MTYLFNMSDFKDITFEQFYKLYPRKVGRYLAEKNFKKLSAKEKLMAYQGLSKYKKFWKANKTDKQFIPHPSTFINQKRWEDDIEVPKTPQKKYRDIDSEVREARRREEELLDNAADTEDIKEALSGFFKEKRWKK